MAADDAHRLLIAANAELVATNARLVATLHAMQDELERTREALAEARSMVEVGQTIVAKLVAPSAPRPGPETHLWKVY